MPRGVKTPQRSLARRLQAPVTYRDPINIKNRTRNPFVSQERLHPKKEKHFYYPERQPNLHNDQCVYRPGVTCLTNHGPSKSKQKQDQNPPIHRGKKVFKQHPSRPQSRNEPSIGQAYVDWALCEKRVSSSHEGWAFKMTGLVIDK